MWQYLLVVAFTLTFIRWFIKKPSSIPGYDGVPVLGVLPFLGTNPAVTFMEWSNKLGPVFHVKMGMRNAVVLNDYESMHECLTTKCKASSDRPNFGALEEISKDGLVFAKYGPSYLSKMKVIIQSLRRFTEKKDGGLGEKIHDEMKYLFDEIDSQNGKGFYIKNSFANVFASAICNISFGKRLAWDDRILKIILDMMDKTMNNEEDNMYVQLLAMCGSLKYIPPFSGAFKRVTENANKVKDVINEFIKEHRESYNKDTIRDTIDSFFACQDDDPNNSAFKDEHLPIVVRDFFNAGIDTTVTYFMWCLLYLASNEDVQEKIYSEICEAGIDLEKDFPKYECRDQMPFTLSFMDEIHRLRPVAPLSLWRRVTERMTVSKVSIPKGTTIIPNLWAVHHSSKYFNEPQKIIPDRFVDKMSGKFVKSPHVIPFGMGMRKCIGYKLAEKEIFLVLCSIIQKYKIFEDPDSPLPDFNDFVFGFVFSPKPYKLRFEKR